MYSYLCVYLRPQPLDRLSGRCFACESEQGRNCIIRLGLQRGGAGLDEDWGAGMFIALIRFLKDQSEGATPQGAPKKSVETAKWIKGAMKINKGYHKQTIRLHQLFWAAFAFCAFNLKVQRPLKRERSAARAAEEYFRPHLWNLWHRANWK